MASLFSGTNLLIKNSDLTGTFLLLYAYSGSFRNWGSRQSNLLEDQPRSPSLFLSELAFFWKPNSRLITVIVFAFSYLLLTFFWNLQVAHEMRLGSSSPFFLFPPVGGLLIMQRGMLTWWDLCLCLHCCTVNKSWCNTPCREHFCDELHLILECVCFQFEWMLGVIQHRSLRTSGGNKQVLRVTTPVLPHALLIHKLLQEHDFIKKLGLRH